MAEQHRRRLTTGQAAKLFSVTSDAVLKWIKEGRLPADRTAGGHYRIECRDVEALIRARRAAEPHPPPHRCTPRPLRCWEYMSDHGILKEDCRKCVVYRIRAAWCFQVLALGAGETGHSKLFCRTSCEDCVYYRRVKGLPIHTLVVTADEAFIKDLAAQESEGLVLDFARSGYDASARIAAFRPDFALVDEDLLVAGETGLLDCLARDPRVPGLKLILAVSPSLEERPSGELETAGATVLVKPVGLAQIAQVIGALPVESWTFHEDRSPA